MPHKAYSYQSPLTILQTEAVRGFYPYKEMTVNLDIFELGYLLDTCLRGSHLRASTVDRFVDEWFLNFTEDERMRLFEWAVRLSYAWNGNHCFEPSTNLCGADVRFMKRYHPDNQYMVTLVDEKKKPQTVRAYLMDGKYYVGTSRYCGEEFITKVEHLHFPEWEKHKHQGVDYDKNIL